MHYRSWIGRPPRITFTNDFHELVRGDLVPGRRVVLRYDPLRIVPPDDGYVFGDPNRPVIAHAASRRSGEEDATTVLVSPAGVLEDPDVDETGTGSMLRGELTVPSDAEELSLWFTYESPTAGTCVDNDDGTKFRFGFASVQLEIRSADVMSKAAGQKGKQAGAAAATGVFVLEIAARPEVDRLTVRVAFVNHRELGKVDHDLMQDGPEEPGLKIWTLPDVKVPSDAIIRYKLYYWIGGVRYKDDNSGEYYLAPPPPPEKVPPPPSGLAEAAQRWA
jgi:hypothetical protein